MIRPRVLLLCGGRSEEHEVSLASGSTPALVVGRPLAWALSVLGAVGWLLGARRGRRDPGHRPGSHA